MTEQLKAMRQALDALESYHGYMQPLLTVFGGPRVPAEQSTTTRVEKAITALRTAIEAAEKQEPVGWLYPEGLDALQRGKCWTAYGTKQDDNCNIPVYLNAAVAPKVEPAKAECGGFDSRPAAPVQEPHSWYSPDLGDYTRTNPEMGEGVTWIALFAASTSPEARPAIPEGWKLVPIAEHIYNGACPEPASPDDRDPECPACRTMMNTPPAAQRQSALSAWVGLTTADLDEIDAPIRERGSATIAEIYRAIEAKLREKNGA